MVTLFGGTGNGGRQGRFVRGNTLCCPLWTHSASLAGQKGGHGV